MQVGEQVEAYNPKTHKMEFEPILHVWIHTDNDLVDLTLTTLIPAGHGKSATRSSEVIHTNQEHPFLTEEKGFLPVGQIKLGMHVLQVDGTYGVVTGWKNVPGASVMYNLEVAQDHTFAVGDGQWIVHNACFLTSGPGKYLVGSYRDVRSAVEADTATYGGYQVHHIFQDAAMRDLGNDPSAINSPLYSYYDAPAIALPRSAHLLANATQNAYSAGFRAAGYTFLLFREAQYVADQSLSGAGVGGTDLSDALNYATDYFTSRWTSWELDHLRVPL